MSEAQSYRAPVEATFTFPAPLQEEIGYRSVTIKELSPSAESAAMARASMDGARLVQELVRESIVRATKVSGEITEISTANESIDIFHVSIGPKGRTLLMGAYTAMNQPKQDENKLFLESAAYSTR